MKVKAVERLLKFTKNENDPGVYRYVMKPEMYSSLAQVKVIREAALRSEGLLGCSRRSDQGMGYRGSRCGSARTGHHAIRTALEGSGEGRGREGRSDFQPSHHFHTLCGPEGRAGQHRYPDYLLRPHGQGGEARDLYLWRGGRRW